MFSYLTRGYGTWEGVAKLEKPDSAIRTNNGSYDFLPPIEKNQTLKFYEKFVEPNGKYKKEENQLKLPEVAKNSLYVPKTYTTKRGALLLYSESCFLPGSRRMKKRPKMRRRKEDRLKTLKDLITLIMEYKKNGCDPLLLEQLWHRINGSDLQPGYSPKRYLSHLSHKILDEESLKKLMESGSLKNLSVLDKSFLASTISDDYGYSLNNRPPPYKTMSLPPVSPSNSMLDSYTFYNNAFSTGAASMVSLPSMNVETTEDQLSLSDRTAGTFVESLTERLAEVDSEAGFKRDYETLTSKEKEEVLTHFLMDVTLYGQKDISMKAKRNKSESSTVVQTDQSYIKSSSSSPTFSVKPTTGEGSIEDDNTRRCSRNRSESSTPQSTLSAKKSQISLPPISNRRQSNTNEAMAGSYSKTCSSESGSGLSIVVKDLDAASSNDFDSEIEDVNFKADYTGNRSRRMNEEIRSLESAKALSEQSLVKTLSANDEELICHNSNDMESLKSQTDGFQAISCDGNKQEVTNYGESIVKRSEGDGSVSRDSVVSDTGYDDMKQEVTNTNFDIKSNIVEQSEEGKSVDGDGVVRDCDGNNDGSLDASVRDVAKQTESNEEYLVDQGAPCGYSVPNTNTQNKEEGIIDGQPPTVSSIEQELPTLSHDAPHITLSNFQEETRVIATEVLARPKSGSELDDDAKIATYLLLERMQRLLDPKIPDEKRRVTSAATTPVRPLGELRKTTKKGKGRTRSAVAAVDLRNLVDQQDSMQVEKQIQDDKVNKGEGTSLDTDVPTKANEMKEHSREDKESSLQTTFVVEETTKTVDVREKSHKKGKSRKGRKVKKVGNAKRVKKGKKSQDVARAQNEPPKTPPFRAGLVPESKPPKGLTQNAGTNEKTIQKNDESPEVQDKVEYKAEDQIKVDSSSSPVRVDSETGEVKKRLSPEKSQSRRGSKNSQKEDPAVRSEGNSSRVQSVSSRDQTPTQSASSREMKACPREKEAAVTVQNVITNDSKAENADTSLKTETSEREGSPEIVLTEKQRRAKARAEQRAAAAERRRREVERKRREREEAKRRAQEEEARLEVLRKDAEEERERREEERRIQKENEERERARLEAEQHERSRQERLMIERQRRAREEWKRKKEQLMAERKFEEELRRERERVEAEIEEENKREYEEKIAHLEEEERERLMEDRRLEEERIKREIREEEERREADRLIMLEERRKLEEEMEAAKERQFARRHFLEMLLRDFQNLFLEQRISRSFTFSYFDILPWFKDRWRDLDESRSSRSKTTSTVLDTVHEEEEFDIGLPA